MVSADGTSRGRQGVVVGLRRSLVPPMAVCRHRPIGWWSANVPFWRSFGRQSCSPLPRRRRQGTRLCEVQHVHGLYCFWPRRTLCRGWGGEFRAGIVSLGKFSEGEICATIGNPKADTASRTHCTAKALRFRHPFLKDENFPRNYPPPPSTCARGGPAYIPRTPI